MLRILPAIGILLSPLQSASAGNTGGSGNTGVLSNLLPYRYIAIKTNLAYDACAILNIAGEVEVADKITAELPVAWSLWDLEPDKGLRIVALQPGIRYYFNRIGSGHAIGADISVAWYNLKHGSKRYQDTSRPLSGLGINYSYTLPLTADWSAEFLIGVGYANTRYNTYENVSNGPLLSTHIHNYFGPTRLAISLVYTL